MSHLSIQNFAASKAFPLCCQIAKKTKIFYNIVYSIASHFYRELINLIQKCSNVVLEFDKSLNIIFQKRLKWI